MSSASSASPRSERYNVSETEAKAQIAEIETTMKTIAAGRKLHGPTLDDVLTLKYLHQRYTNYLAWLKWSK